ncbi:DinB family protein [Pararhizobium antarcticum]|uniref:Diguanylate cyclase n=1 Tax=Pararhizobium antarcticum TaxID=1798805 RepID=A0A657LXK0_9HYPH|nr:DinB family protein [Pararhizobium antarcticum]OJF95186.1 diguanylate cyclase [Rhizobium sp. 58]OJG00729.1 diguanylate cyclase [Pararhizobium antarcticum]
MIDHFRMFANYNGWANGLVYTAAAGLTDGEFREAKGAFFGSLHATLNHILCADRIWLKRFTGAGAAPGALDTILFEDLAALTAARKAEDARIKAFIDGLTPERLSGSFTYTPITSPVETTQKLSPSLAHLFNHQTHHRGQCHMTLTALGKPSLALDMVYFLRAAEGRGYAG